MSFTDAALAERVARELLTDRYVYVRGIGWHAYDGRRWSPCPDSAVVEVVRAWTVARGDAAYADFRAGTGTKSEVASWLKRQDLRPMLAVVRLAAGLLALDPDDLDANPEILNCRNGVVYLPTGDLIPHDPGLYLTKITGCDYIPTALHADWTAALSAVPADVLDWLQVRYGQAITGHASPDDKVLIQQGGGANGKSTVLVGVANALGDYYLLASDKILMGSHSGAHTTDFTDLRGSRFVAIEELPELGRLDAAALKRVCGTERITARRMRMDNFTFPVSHTLILNTNYAPAVAETDAGTWRRLLLVMFPYTFTKHPLDPHERQGDPRLRERLKVSADGQSEAVLAWLVEGATRWYEASREMPGIPATVQGDTDEWRGRHDHVAQFWADHLDVDPGAYVYAGDLIWMFNNFMRQHGNAPLAESTFLRRFRTHPLTAASEIAKRRVRQGPGQRLVQSRPFGALDPFSRLPGVPAGQIWAWTGLRFRTSTEDDSWDSGSRGESGESGRNA